MDAPLFDNRRQLFDYLERQMDASYRQVLGARRLEFESTYLKTYLVEVDPEISGGQMLEPESLRDLLAIPPLRDEQPVRPQVVQSEEAGFMTAHWDTTPPVRLYIDAVADESGRFVVAHTLSDASMVDRALERIVDRRPHIDHAWFWPRFLEETQSSGDFRGLGVSYDHRRFQAAEGVDDPDDYFSMQLSGGAMTQDIYTFLRAHDQIGPRTVVDKVKLKYWSDRTLGKQFALEDVYLRGKFTARGTSFSSHLDLVLRSMRRYRDTIDALEAAYVIRYASTRGDGIGLTGAPIHMILEEGHRIEDVPAFCEVVFSGRQPFRLWGLPSQVAGEPEALQVDATDLHTGSPMFFEVYPDAISLYLYEGTCANTALRFYANLQHTIGRRVSMVGDNGEPIS